MVDLSEADKGWIAGVFDGEGTVGAYMHKGDNSVRLNLSVDNIDPRMCLKLYHLLGGTLNEYRVNSPNYQQVYRWRTGGRRAGKILTQILPYLVIKREQAALAIQIADTLSHRCDSRKKIAPHIVELRKDAAKKMKALKRQDFSKFWTPSI